MMLRLSMGQALGLDLRTMAVTVVGMGQILQLQRFRSGLRRRGLHDPHEVGKVT
jgi:hypothetical protein